MISKRFHKPYSWALRAVGLMLAVSITSTWCVPAIAKDSASAAEQPMRSPQETIASFQLPDGFEIRLVAAEPDLVNPMTMAIDEQGRVYVSQAHTYRYGPDHAPINPPANPVVRFEFAKSVR